ELLLLNQLVNLVHSLQCVHSTQVELLETTLHKGCLEFRNCLKLETLKGKPLLVNLLEQFKKLRKVKTNEKLSLKMTQKVLVTLCLIMHVLRYLLEMKLLLVRNLMKDPLTRKNCYKYKVSTVFNPTCCAKYSEYTACKELKSVINT